MFVDLGFRLTGELVFDAVMRITEGREEGSNWFYQGFSVRHYVVVTIFSFCILWPFFFLLLLSLRSFESQNAT